MRRIIFSDSATNNVLRLRRFLAKENPIAAKKAAALIMDAANRLIDNPFIGKPVNNMPHYRDLLTRFGVGGYVLRYRIHLEIIYIVHVRHYREEDFKSR
ncbi:MAG: type II toxin-antitoxin system RelE/ParE family toxin [Gammaproteobacteria bacterium]|nr:type II toxin-antitoxin system RelE/ParE family toxin [Gammaproteobacteria bacterium]